MKKLKRTDWAVVIRKIQAKGLTQQDITDKTGVPQGKISLMLKGANIYYDGGKALMRLLNK